MVFNRVDFHDFTTNSFKKPALIKQPRHETGAAVMYCKSGKIYIPLGAGVVATSFDI